MDCSPPGTSVCGDSPGVNAGVGCHDLLQGIFPIQELNTGLSHCRRILTVWSTRKATSPPPKKGHYVLLEIHFFHVRILSIIRNFICISVRFCCALQNLVAKTINIFVSSWFCGSVEWLFWSEPMTCYFCNQVIIRYWADQGMDGAPQFFSIRHLIFQQVS